jgi:hypothetical protein
MIPGFEIGILGSEDTPSPPSKRVPVNQTVSATTTPAAAASAAADDSWL